MKHGEIMNAEKIREGLRNLTSMYGEEGYIDFTAEPEFDFDNAGNTIDMVILIRPDKQYRIREIEFWV